MSGRILEDAISFSDDEDDYTSYLDDEIYVQGYDQEETSDDDEPITIDGDDDDDIAIVDSPPPIFAPSPKEFELPSLSHESGFIYPGSIVELHDHSERTSDHLLSGDFLLVRSIVEDVEAEEIVLRGFRMRRVEYLQPLFNRKFNDLFMLINVASHDDRPRFVQGLETIAPEEVVRVRQCVFTHLDYDLMGQSHVNSHAPARLQSKSEIREWLFRRGKLICRWVHVVEQDPTGKSYGGEVRRMYKREVADFSQPSAPAQPPTAMTSRSPSIPRPTKPSLTKGREHANVVSKGSPKSLHCCQHLQKSRIQGFADGFSGAGGASSGAQQAGYRILWGLEKDPLAMQAYRMNFPKAMHLEMDAHDFPAIIQRCVHGCDHVHMSCPCCYWSQMHTVAGVNDQANLETFLEQTPGLLTLEKHRMYFRILLNGILNAGCNVRYKIQDQAWFGVAQHRRRLVFVGARIGFPLPPFPTPIHGPPGSGLKRYVTIEDALRRLQHQTLRHDPYHQPDREKRIDQKATDPHVNLAHCVTTSGDENVHYSGTRPYTCRELSQFQGFSLDFRFTGSVTEAKKQCGNAWPPVASRVYFLTWAAHKECFERGHMDAEDEVLDLYDFLEKKGITIPKPVPIDIDSLNSLQPNSLQPPSRAAEIHYRYVNRIDKTVKPRHPLQLWARRKAIDPIPTRRRTNYNLPHNPSQVPRVLGSRSDSTARGGTHGAARSNQDIITIDDSD
ncbi:S-adenosyl-L-methionine-dependent methyltransferase [Pyrenochaeta sp. MPI-SDFR-AT-0127]|nr:S-adenosyl-L-methionine-dependent methyltransferase [Pyrenochaeta sp. MPI-SDFR-AT-0127]